MEFTFNLNAGVSEGLCDGLLNMKVQAAALGELGAFLSLFFFKFVFVYLKKGGSNVLGHVHVAFPFMARCEVRM